jgi:hypothetical protein
MIHFEKTLPTSYQSTYSGKAITSSDVRVCTCAACEEGIGGILHAHQLSGLKVFSIDDLLIHATL